MNATSNSHWQVDHDAMDAAYAMRPRPWVEDPKYFKEVRMSALAAMKILMHAKTGQGKKGRIGSEGDHDNWIEVMGLMQGHFTADHVLVITDSFALPVDASEVECSMSDASQAYMLQYLQHSRDMMRPDAGCVGWYHSHPGYSCFLSGIDVNTQRNNQSAMDPWVAVVVDPVQSLVTGKIEIKAFRTLPERFVSGGGSATAAGAASVTPQFDTSMIPMEKIAELGVHFNQYYELPITLFRSVNDAAQLEQLSSETWASYLSQIPLANIADHFAVTQLGCVVRLMKEEVYAREHVAGATARPTWVKNAQILGCEQLRGALTLQLQDALSGGL